MKPLLQLLILATLAVIAGAQAEFFQDLLQPRDSTGRRVKRYGYGGPSYIGELIGLCCSCIFLAICCIGFIYCYIRYVNEGTPIYVSSRSEGPSSQPTRIVVTRI
ncbi:unnamed protein product, partial [Mesorhabditis spiculigera]